jgi:hypothetical protein
MSTLHSVRPYAGNDAVNGDRAKHYGREQPDGDGVPLMAERRPRCATFADSLSSSLASDEDGDFTAFP